MKFKRVVVKQQSLLAALTLTLLAATAAQADLLAPARQQIDWRLRYLAGTVDASSFINVRELDVPGDDIGFRDLGMETAHLPTLDAAYWFNDHQALAFQFRYFLVHGSASLAEPKKFNGTVLAANTPLDADSSRWYSLSLFYEHRFSSTHHPRWEWRGLAGLEYTAINFTIDGGHAPLDPSSPGQETKEGFDAQELPIPTLGAVSRRMRWCCFAAGTAFNRWREFSFTRTISGKNPTRTRT